MHAWENYRLLSFPLDRLVTKNQWQNTKCQLKFLLLVRFEKRSGKTVLFSFSKRNGNRKFSWYLVFSHWFLVNGLSNGKDIYVVLLVKLSNDCKCSLDELPKRVTMKVIKVKTIKMALGMIIVADSGASKFNQHLKLSLIIRFIVLLHYCILLFLGKEFQDSYFPDCWFGVWSDKKARLDIIVFMSVKIFFCFAQQE